MTYSFLGRAAVPGTAVSSVSIGAVLLIKMPVRYLVYVITVHVTC